MLHLVSRGTAPTHVLLSFLLLSGLLTGCGRSYFLVGDAETRHTIKELLRLQEDAVGKTRFTLIKQVSDLLYNNGEQRKQILFLTQYVEKNPEDTFNAFYLTLVAKTYEEMDAVPFSIHYYERILKNYPDIMVAGSSIHFHCLRKLLEYNDIVESRIEYYKEVISRFDHLIDVGFYYYSLAKAYEAVGEWDLSIQNYKRFLASSETIMPGHPNAYREIAEQVAFYDSDKRWTVSDLSFLVKEIQSALVTKNTAKLLQYKAKKNFFSKYWGQKDFDESLAVYFNINNWLLKSRVRFSLDLDSDSTSKEAFLKTWNWLYRVDTWYFYFRRIDYPADPEIDGRWEWAGIYFGEKS